MDSLKGNLFSPIKASSKKVVNNEQIVTNAWVDLLAQTKPIIIKKDVKLEHFHIDAKRIFPDSLTDLELFEKENNKDVIASKPGSRYKKKNKKGKEEEFSTAEKLPEISAENKYLAMLGYTTLDNGVMNPVLWREDFCGVCGTQHPDPSMLDMYNICYSCFNTLREPIKLRKRFAAIPLYAPLDILYATYGDPFYVQLSYEVTPHIVKIIDANKFRDRLQFKEKDDLSYIFGGEFGRDPNPNNNKQLRIRYRMDSSLGVIYGTLCLDVLPNNHLPYHFMLVKPKDRALRIIKASYGYPRGAAVDGRMSYDVTEIVQGLVDVNGGSFLTISNQQSLFKFFGDPCPGYTKDLRVQYEMTGRWGKDVYDEDGRGYLKRRVLIETSPTIAPLILVQSAFYGVTPTGRKDHVAHIKRELRKIYAIETKIKLGMIISPDEMFFLRKKEALEEEKRIFQNIPINFIDISKKVQTLADEGGSCLFIDKKTFDPNSSFSNPSKGNHKLLEINVLCYGHDSERQTDSKDMTGSGHPRNFITRKNARFIISVHDHPTSTRGIMSESIKFATDYSAPLIYVSKAIYGNFDDLSKCIDVTSDVQALVKGRFLRIERNVNLDALFSDPCPGRRKQLKIEYSARGFMGNIRVHEKNDFLAAKLEIGFPPQAERDEAEDYL